MEHYSIILIIFIIFSGAAIFSTLALYMKQSLFVAYMLLGIVLGPWGLGVITNLDAIHKVDDIGIIFLMFLLGLHLKPQSLLNVIYKTLWITLASSIVFFVLGVLVGYWSGYGLIENLIIGFCMMFSSTIIGLKLLPADVESHRYANEVMIGILLMQDLMAVLVLLGVDMLGSSMVSFSRIILTVSSLPAILLFVFLVERFILKKIFTKFSKTHEYMFVVAVAWCLGIAQLAEVVGLSYEIGAFIAGVAIAASPITFYISGQMQPIRDFFLVLFFFIIGASFNLYYLNVVIIPVLVLTAIFLVLKPLIFGFLLRLVNETKEVAREIGIRLGQLSEFSLLVIFLAERNELISQAVVYLVQAVTILTFIFSSYLVTVHCSAKNIPKSVIPSYEAEE